MPKKTGVEASSIPQSLIANIRQLSVLQNDVVLRTTFKFLDFQSLKTCRLVHSKWKSVCEPRFRKRTRVCSQSRINENVMCDISILQRLFSQEEFEVPITILNLGGRWKVSELLEFFNNEGMSITELILKDLEVFEDKGDKYESFDASFFFIPSLKRLKISNTPTHGFWPHLIRTLTSFSVSLDVVKSLDYLYLRNGKLTFGDGFFSPVELFLEGHNEYFFKGEQNKVLPLNEFVDFRRLENLTIKDDNCNISVDFKDCVALKNLELPKNVKMLNWEPSQFSIDSLRLENMNFLQKDQIPRMVKSCYVTDSKVDLSLLPTTVEELFLESCSEVKQSSHMYLPNLKHLKFVHNTSFDFLAYFKNCDTIKELRLELVSNHLMFNAENIPKSVEKLVLSENPMSRFIGSRSFVLDTLSVTCCRSFNNWQISKLPAKHIFCLKPNGDIFSDDVMRRIIQFSIENCETISVGEFTWSSQRQFSKSYISDYVDKQAEYYTFKAGRGEAVPKKVVWDMCWSWTH